MRASLRESKSQHAGRNQRPSSSRTISHYGLIYGSVLTSVTSLLSHLRPRRYLIRETVDKSSERTVFRSRTVSRMLAKGLWPTVNVRMIPRSVGVVPAVTRKAATTSENPWWCEFDSSDVHDYRWHPRMKHHMANFRPKYLTTLLL